MSGQISILFCSKKKPKMKDKRLKVAKTSRGREKIEASDAAI